ncbi:MAG: DUF2191 domain-containing protein [Alphaproteobacteria bacterium]|nr:DUF2191 domain-containing protein [Alphaproteobacteria bacterium]
MRITVDVDDELLEAVRDYAVEKRMTLKAAVERALRELLASPAGADAPPIPVFRGEGVQPGVDLVDSQGLAAVLDAER